jgi:hypothetical protein
LRLAVHPKAHVKAQNFLQFMFYSDNLLRYFLPAIQADVMVAQDLPGGAAGNGTGSAKQHFT